MSPASRSNYLPIVGGWIQGKCPKISHGSPVPPRIEGTIASPRLLEEPRTKEAVWFGHRARLHAIACLTAYFVRGSSTGIGPVPRQRCTGGLTPRRSGWGTMPPASTPTFFVDILVYRERCHSPQRRMSTSATFGQISPTLCVR